MKRRSKSTKRRPRRQTKVLLLFGESENDRGAIKELVEGLHSKLNGHIELRRRPLVLVKGVSGEELAQRKHSLAAQVEADRVRFDVRGVLIHEDCDDVEPAHEAAARRYEDAFAGAAFQVYPVLPAWELEAWWLLWPQALSAYRASWREPAQYRNKHVGKVRNAKEALRAAVVPRSLSAAEKKRFRTYEESDSPGIAKKVRALGLLAAPEGQSDSYESFRQMILAIEL